MQSLKGKFKMNQGQGSETRHLYSVNAHQEGWGHTGRGGGLTCGVRWGGGAHLEEPGEDEKMDYYSE